MKRRRFVITGLVICIALGFLGYVVYTLLESKLDYYLTVSELKEKGESVYDQGVRVNGYVSPGSIESDPENRILTFTITDSDGNESLYVTYEGSRPDNFGDETQVVLEGKLDSTGLFHASSILTKCSDYYESE